MELLFAAQIPTAWFFMFCGSLLIIGFAYLLQDILEEFSANSAGCGALLLVCLGLFSYVGLIALLLWGASVGSIGVQVACWIAVVVVVAGPAVIFGMIAGRTCEKAGVKGFWKCLVVWPLAWTAFVGLTSMGVYRIAWGSPWESSSRYLWIVLGLGAGVYLMFSVPMQIRRLRTAVRAKHVEDQAAEELGRLATKWGAKLDE